MIFSCGCKYYQNGYVDASECLMHRRYSKPMKLELINWVDSSSPAEAGWHKKEEMNLVALSCESVGWVIEEDARQITLAAHITEAGQLNGVITIPKSCITKRAKWKPKTA